MKVLVLGGTGFIGRSLCQRLLTMGAIVTTMSRSPAVKIGAQHHHIQASIGDSSALQSIIPSHDVVYHFAHTNIPAEAEKDWSRDLAENVLPAVGVAKACADAKCRLVFASSGGTIYGKPIQIPTPETAPTAPISAYGVSKLCIENVLRLGSLKFSLPVTALRISNPFGPFQSGNKGQGVIAAFLAAALKGKPIQIWGDGSVVRDYVYIDDVVDALIMAAEKSNGFNVYNVGSGIGRSINEIILGIEEVTGRPLARTYTSSRTLDVPISILCVKKIRDDLSWRPNLDFIKQLSKTYDALTLREEI